MGRRRWRVVTIAAFLLFVTKDAQCQGEVLHFYSGRLPSITIVYVTDARSPDVINSLTPGIFIETYIIALL